MGKVKYKPLTLGGHRTEENQALILAHAAHRAWNLWCEPDGHGGYKRSIVGIDKDFDNAMRRLYQAVHETDVFYSGKEQGRNTNGN
jgi:hypothetical protein